MINKCEIWHDPGETLQIQSISSLFILSDQRGEDGGFFSRPLWGCDRRHNVSEESAILNEVELIPPL